MQKQYHICLDVGGTKVLGAIFDGKDQIIYRLKKRTKSGGEGTSSQEALYWYFSTRRVSAAPEAPKAPEVPAIPVIEAAPEVTVPPAQPAATHAESRWENTKRKLKDWFS